MKIIGMTAFAASLAVILAAGAACAGTLNDKAPAAKSRNVCLQTYKIDHTTYKREDNSILFYMRSGKIWKNHLRTPCSGLSFNGFAYVNHTGEICGNLQSIRVLQTKEICMLGSFTPYEESKLEKAAGN